MEIEDFYIEEAVAATADPWGEPDTTRTRTRFNHDLVTQLRAGPIPGDDDLETAITFTRLVHGDLELFGTSGGEQFTNEEIQGVQRCLRSVLNRQGIELRLPWRDFSSFYTYWKQNDATGSWQARRDILDGFFRPVFEELDRLEEKQFHAVVAEAVSPHPATGWVGVDAELTELKRRFRSAATPQDYRDIGNRCVGVLEALSRTVYLPDKHLRDGETVPPVDKTKARIGRYVEDSLVGADNAEIRGVATKVIELAHKVKHSSAPSRRDAGITADAVILLANILRRVDQDF